MVEPLTTEELGIVEETVLSLLRKGKAEAKPSRQIIAELQSLGIDLGGRPDTRVAGHHAQIAPQRLPDLRQQ
jgi:hypothetical protein